MWLSAAFGSLWAVGLPASVSFWLSAGGCLLFLVPWAFPTVTCSLKPARERLLMRLRLQCMQCNHTSYLLGHIPLVETSHRSQPHKKEEIRERHDTNTGAAGTILESATSFFLASWGQEDWTHSCIQSQPTKAGCVDFSHACSTKKPLLF